MQTQSNAVGAPVERRTLTATYTIECYDRGPEPAWHKDRDLFAPWQPVALVAYDTEGNTIAEVHGFRVRDAWFRFASAVC